ncbi:4Fe-4S dicluster domain-containing protein [candidate division KSB1 bacterium]
MHYLASSDIRRLLERLHSSSNVFIPYTNNDNNHFFVKNWTQEDTQSGSFVFNAYRTSLPFTKWLLNPPVSITAQYTLGAVFTKAADKTQIIFGVKACDLSGKKVLDAVLLKGDYVDLLYKQQSESSIIISGDCKEALPSCFCTLVGNKPYPEEGYDLNMSPITGGFIFESGSEKGNTIIKDNHDLFTVVSKNRIAERDRQRERLIEILKNQNQVYGTEKSRKEIIERNLAAPIWHDVSRTCVECNNCNYVCPTCYCFYLYDQKHNGNNERIKVWDSCFHAGYARMAGGLTPRLHLVDRFKNHYYHKFDSFVTNFGFEACSGCGRCIESCMGGIDKREVLKSLEKFVVLK